MGNPTPDPRPADEYERRRAAHAAATIRLERRERLAGWSRIGAFVVIVAVSFAVRPANPLFVLWLAAPAIAFVSALAWHRNVVRAHLLSRRAERYFSRGLDRLNDRWVGHGPTGERHSDPAHPYAADLDVFGRGSLYQYVCAAHTPSGQDTLAAWLCAPADPQVVRDRQGAIAELRGRLDLREALGSLGDPERPELKTRALLTWPEAPAILDGRGGPILAWVLGTFAVAGVVGWAGFGTGPSPVLLVAMIEIIVMARSWGRISAVTRDSRVVLEELQAFLPALRLLETQRFESPLLISVCESLAAGGDLPSVRVARLSRMLDAWDTAIRNQFVLPAAVLLMVPLHLAHAIERWRRRDGRYVRGWLEAVGTFEALCSLAAFAYEHPDYPFPSIDPVGPVLDAEGLAQPLLPAGRRVANDVRLGLQPALLLVSGSNMAGKSTLMRAVGLNVVLALAGAPICARRLTVSPLIVATAMRQADSLHDGVSAFYAEIRRLQAIRELTAGPRRVLFLLDEILRGTNSHDRRVGAEAVIVALLRGGGIGMVSTHDLTLAEIVDRLGAQAANVHFEDQLSEGKISFDYRLRPGVVPRGNGLVLLRLLGFEV